MLISKNAQGVLKVLHFLTISFWMGGCLSLALLMYAATNAQGEGELLGILKSHHFINIILTVYLGAYGVFFTGLAYSLLTNRGFLRHKWVIIKWVLTLAMILGGGFLLNPWVTEMLEAAANGAENLQDAGFMHMYRRYLLVVAGYMLLFVLMTALSVFKPWEKAELTARQRKAQSSAKAGKQRR